MNPAAAVRSPKPLVRVCQRPRALELMDGGQARISRQPVRRGANLIITSQNQPLAVCLGAFAGRLTLFRPSALAR